MTVLTFHWKAASGSANEFRSLNSSVVAPFTLDGGGPLTLSSQDITVLAPASINAGQTGTFFSFVESTVAPVSFAAGGGTFFSNIENVVAPFVVVPGTTPAPPEPPAPGFTSLDVTNGWNNATNDPTYSNGNLTAAILGGTSSTTGSVRSIMSIAVGTGSGLRYYEVTPTYTNLAPLMGFARSSFTTSTGIGTVGGHSWWPFTTPQLNGAWSGNYGQTITSGTVIGVLVDVSTRQVTYFRNGVSMGVAPALLPADTYHAWAQVAGSSHPATLTFNFGATPFAYPQPGAVGWTTA